VIATVGSDGPGAGPGMLWRQRVEPVTHLGGTNELMIQVYNAWLRLDETGHQYPCGQPLVPTGPPGLCPDFSNHAILAGAPLRN
jgi:hypothetical protein